MLHFLLLVGFSGATGLVLGAMLRHSLADALRLALWICASMTTCGLVLAWLMLVLPN